MSKLSVCQFLRFADKNGTYIPGRSYQNVFPDQLWTYQGESYQFAPYLVKGSSSTRGGDNSSASIVTVPNDLTVSLLTEAVASQWIVRIRTGIYVPEEGGAFTFLGTISDEIWGCTNCIQTEEKVEAVLSSPSDASKDQFPKRVLSSYLVGALPPTGSIVAT